MPDLRVAHWRNRYRIPADARDDRARLDQVLRDVATGTLLEAALERAGIASGEELCIRRLDAFVRLDRDDRDETLAVAWSVALADAIAERVREGGPDVVRYRSPHLALVDMARAVARDDLTNAWAWRQLGISEHEHLAAGAAARVHAIDVLARNPHAATAVVAEVARAGLLGALGRGVPATSWIRLAHRVLEAIGASEALLAVAARRLTGDGAPTDVARLLADGARFEALVARIDRCSAIHHAVVRSVADPLTATAFAALAMVEQEPRLARSDDAVPVIASLAARATTTRPDSTPERRGATSDTPTDPDRPVPPRDERATATTAFGGLLFLLHAMRALDIPSALASHELLGGRPSRWCLHQLALALAACEPGDPAALAFAGLPPDASPLSLDDAPPTDAERAAIAAFRDPLCTWMRQRGGAMPEETDAAMLRRSIQRTAIVIADPAWIELRFALADASVELRRAGLDLDPGWVPWLGVVLRFVYA